MKFGPCPVADAAGAILAHSIRARRSVDRSSYKIAKGTWLTDAHVADLQNAGIPQVTVARLEAGDVHEDAAATDLAAALVGDGTGLARTKASTGRVNLRAQTPGLAEIDATAINAINGVHPGITVATVPQLCRLDQRTLAATVKIIPYAVPSAALASACAAAQGAMRLASPVLTSATLIETQVGDDAPSDKGRKAVAERLARLGVSLSDRVVVGHKSSAIAAALADARGELLLILTASATSDLCDTAPQGVRDAGGAVDHYGMPVDPGNLLFLGSVQGRVVIGLPGCARSPALNGADWVIERVICGRTPGAQDIMGMGVGGLLKEIPSRPRPREG